jgi:hypothetical protein
MVVAERMLTKICWPLLARNVEILDGRVAAARSLSANLPMQRFGVVQYLAKPRDER